MNEQKQELNTQNQKLLFKRLDLLSDQQLKDVTALYDQSFPDSERKPFSMILKGAASGTMEAYAAYLDETLAAIAFVILGNPIHVLDYLAVNPNLRSQGIGSEVLKWLKSLYKQPFVVEIESTLSNENKKSTQENSKEKDEAKRRKEFYLRNGMKESGFEFDLFGVRMELLSSGKPVSFPTYYSVMENYFDFDPKPYIRLIS